MSLPDLSHIRGVVWDLDGTLYRYDALFKDACQLAAARTAIDLGIDMSFEEAVALATESERLYGSSFRLFGERGIRYEDFHHPYHDCIDTAIVQKNAEMRAALEALDVPMVILTNASRTWAKRTVSHLEYDHIFRDENLLALEDVGYKAKASSQEGFEKALSVIGIPAEEALMVEDLARNLMIAKRMGMTTALVHHGRGPDDTDYIDTYFQDTIELARVLARR